MPAQTQGQKREQEDTNTCSFYEEQPPVGVFLRSLLVSLISFLPFAPPSPPDFKALKFLPGRLLTQDIGAYTDPFETKKALFHWFLANKGVGWNAFPRGIYPPPSPTSTR